MDMITLAAARKYVNDTANALGAVKGSPCTIKSITETDDGATVVVADNGAGAVQRRVQTAGGEQQIENTVKVNGHGGSGFISEVILTNCGW